MLNRIERSLRQECGVPPGALLLAAVSGGPDSLCLLHSLIELGHRPVVAHFDHQLRPESAADAAHVGKIAASLRLPFVAAAHDVAGYARSRRISVEEAGRELRYTFLFAQARAHAVAAVAVGHTADDQAETVLMHILRGAGLTGLTGMGPRVLLADFDTDIPIVRPLLDVWRHETLEYCRAHQLPAMQDASNESREYTRNRVRLDLIPDLETYNPEIRAALVRLARSTAGDLAIIGRSVGEAWQRTLADQKRGYVGFDAAALAAESSAMQIRLIMLAVARLQPRLEFDYEGLRRAQEFVSSASARRLQLPDGVILYRETRMLYVAMGEAALPSDAWPQLPVRSIPLSRDQAASYALDGTWKFSLEVEDVGAGLLDPAASADSYRGQLDADSLPARFELRAPRPGDRIESLGLQGHSQKLADVFINMHVPERLRARWPVLADDDSVIWIPGFRIAEPFRIRKRTRRAMRVAVRQTG